MTYAPSLPLPDPANPDPASLITDPDAVAFVLYAAPFPVADWFTFGLPFWFRYVMTVLADPRSGVADLVTRALAAHHAGQLTGPGIDACRLATARRYARRIVAAYAN